MTSDDVILALTNLSRRVRGSETELTTVNDVCFEFRKGGIYTLIGPSGSGKSSLLRLINRLDDPTSGTVTFAGQEHTTFSPCELRRRIGYLFQVPHMFDGTVADNIRYASPDLSDEAVTQLARQTHLSEDYVSRSVDNLSIGERQRVAMARLMATEPEVVLLDEPTSGLDPARTQRIEQLILELVAKRNLTAIMITHSPEQALRMKGTALLMHNARLVESGPASEVINNPSTAEGRAYINGEIS